MVPVLWWYLFIPKINRPVIHLWVSAICTQDQRGKAQITCLPLLHLATTQSPKMQTGICSGLLFLLFQVFLCHGNLSNKPFISSVSLSGSADVISEMSLSLGHMISAVLWCQSTALKAFCLRSDLGNELKLLKISHLQPRVLSLVLTGQANSLWSVWILSWVEWCFSVMFTEVKTSFLNTEIASYKQKW